MNPPGMTGVRHAVYYAPPEDHALWRAGCEWLGRDPGQGHAVTLPASAHVAAPWRYGFHATLKAPMTLAEGASEADFVAALRRLAAQHAPFAMPALHVATLGEFVALRPREPLAADHPLRRLADACVVELDRWRNVGNIAERVRHRLAAHAPGQRLNAERYVALYGYAHVLDDWRFHMTLSDPLPDDEARDAVLRAARRHFAPALALPLVCNALCLFVEPQPGTPFELRHRVPLGAHA
ncbi:MAG: DUF1045 domain-containing protein [Burkholderiaceae bacterium]